MQLKRYFQIVLAHRIWVLLVFVAVTALSAWSSVGVPFSTTLQKLFFGDSPEFAEYQERARTFANDDIFIVALETDEPLSDENLSRLAVAVDLVEAHPEVARVDSILGVQSIAGEDGALVVSDLVSDESNVPRAEWAREPGVEGLLVADDGSSLACIVELSVDANRSGEVIPITVREVLSSFEEAGFSAAQIRRAGFPPLVAELTSLVYQAIQQLFPITVLVLLLVVWGLFHRLTPAIVASVVGLLSVVWTLGFASLLDDEFNLFTGIVPAVIMVVTISDVVHLWSAYHNEIRSGRTPQDALLESATDVGMACLLTSATTFVGFVSLSLIPTPVFQQLGLVLGFGVAISLLIAMTLVPIVLSYMRPPSVEMLDRPTLGGRLLDTILAVVTRCSMGSPRVVVGCFGLALVAIAFGLARVTIDTQFAERLSENNGLRQDQDYVERHFAGTQVLDVYVDVPEAEGLLDEAFFARLQDFQTKIEALPQTDKVWSIVDLVEMLHGALDGDGSLPSVDGALSQYLLLFEMSGGEDLDRMVDFERKTTRMMVRTQGLGVRAAYDYGQTIEQVGAQTLGNGARVETTGLLLLIGGWLDEIVEGERNGLILSFGVITLMMMIGLRSVPMGAWSMVPNAFPLLALAAGLGFLWTTIDSDTLVVAMMAIGIGVDDTIHFLMRYRIEFSKDVPGESLDIEKRRERALQTTFSFAGRAIIMTTIILALGYLPLALSEYYSMWMLGVMMPVVLVLALLADLLLVPALLQLGIGEPKLTGTNDS